MLQFKYWFILKEGFIPTMELEEEKEISIIVEAKNRVTADRMVKAMLKGNNNILECIATTCLN